MIEYIEVFCEYIELDAFGQIEMAARTRFLAADQKVPCSLFLSRSTAIADCRNAKCTRNMMGRNYQFGNYGTAMKKLHSFELTSS